ncbi:glutamate--cysteine ligase [Pollutimonas thiosulfatoxidans]|uniref:Glutamate--cysteine ligase n=1 Tax=Pollutimonas thiosulfatoxidans TaxID=2028345 RepID=A0A410GDI2_9BURK|nr:glutamate--cysteine ligase [Pollutimonas thiosulfatoxidans]QAA94340.1 glutamate--cysteine ligase [Pollutimonas thiosulfatoxidans]
MSSSNPRHAVLGPHLPVLKGILRGIEKEGLRVDAHGELATTPHPRALGAPLTHPQITTDYSEALLELITGTHHSTESLIHELEQTHRYVACQLQDELIWNQSMPALLPSEADIPIAWYGTSNTGMLKHVYRRGLAERYGKAMQCIAGVHYNFSLPDALWDVLGTEGATLDEQRSKGYLALIRNFTRYSWLLMYLFGASPAVSSSFVRGLKHDLPKLDEDTLYLPYATSLRMSDLGYQNKAQSDLQLCYNDLETFLARMHAAVTTPWPAYQAIGTHRNGEWIQLSTNILQIENEYYSNIRPKRSTGRCERPATALAERGVQYVEVRCLDIDPLSPTGISAVTSRFMDTFLLFCATEPSRLFPNNGFCRDSHDNFNLVVKEGRKPGLMLIDQNKPKSLADWSAELMERMAPYARLLDQAYGNEHHAAALAEQADKVRDGNNTPSARILQTLRDQGISMHELALQQSMAHRDALRAQPLDAAVQQEYDRRTQESFIAQQQLEDSDTEDFSSYVARYHAALKPPPTP